MGCSSFLGSPQQFFTGTHLNSQVEKYNTNWSLLSEETTHPCRNQASLEPQIFCFPSPKFNQKSDIWLLHQPTHMSKNTSYKIQKAFRNITSTSIISGFSVWKCCIRGNVGTRRRNWTSLYYLYFPLKYKYSIRNAFQQIFNDWQSPLHLSRFILLFCEAPCFGK